MDGTPEDTPAERPEPAPAPAPGKRAKPSKAEKLEAKAARLREAAERAARERAAREDSAATPDGPGPRRPRGLVGWPLVAAGLVVLLLVAAVAYLAVDDAHKGDRIDRLSNRAVVLPAQPAPSGSAQVPVTAPTDTHIESLWASALGAAERYALDFGSYDYAKLDQDFQLVSSHLTKSFAAKYTQISQQLKSVIVQYKGKSTATVQGAGVSSLNAKRAVVVLFLDQTVTSTQSKKPRVDRNRLTMTLQRQPGGGWLISDLELV